MNDKQRQYLIGQVHETYRKQYEALQKTRKPKPSLNNYLIAAFLDNTVEFKDVETLRKKIRDRVLIMGTDQRLVVKETRKDGFWTHHANEDSKSDEQNVVQIPVYDLFVIPQAYKDKFDEWEASEKEITEKQEALTTQKDTITLKLNLGSNQILDKLISEADNLVDLSIVNNNLTLGASTQKQIDK